MENENQIPMTYEEIENSIRESIEKNEGFPKELEAYIREIVGDMKDLGNLERIKQSGNYYAYALRCDKDVETLLKEMRKGIEQNRRDETEKFINILINKLQKARRKVKVDRDEEAIDIQRIVSGILNSKKIANSVMAFLRGIKSLKDKELVKAGAEEYELYSEDLKMLDFLTKVRSKLDEEISDKCKPTKQKLVDEFQQAYSLILEIIARTANEPIDEAIEEEEVEI